MKSVIHEELGQRPVATAFPDASFVVMKFGGTSVSTLENWRTIARLLKQRLAAGLTPVLVHSALAGISNKLQALADGAEPDEVRCLLQEIRDTHLALASDLGVGQGRWSAYLDELEELLSSLDGAVDIAAPIKARIMATGELTATRLGAEFLRLERLPVNWQDAREWLQSVTVEDQSAQDTYLSAHCSAETDLELQERLQNSSGVVVTQGFIARSAGGETVLLGRGGSDTSAAYFAGRLNARRLEIWTDVPGMFSANPKAVSGARLLRALHYREAQEIASAGGGVLHPRCIAPVRRQGIPLFLKCTMHPEWGGTVISAASGEETPRIKAISRRTRITLVAMESMEMWRTAGFLARVFDRFRWHGLSVDLISTSESNVTVSLDLDQHALEEGALTRLVEDLESLCRVRLIENCAAVTLIGRRIRAILPQLSEALEVFEEQRVHLLTQASNDLNLTFVVDEADSFRLVRSLHRSLISSYGEDQVFGPTWAHLQEPAPPRPRHRETWWSRRREELLEIAGREEPVFVYERDSIRQSLRSLLDLDAVDAVFYAMKANPHPAILEIIDEAGGHFECVSPGEIRRLQEVVRGLSGTRILFTPNFAPREEYRWALEQGAWVTLDNLHPLRHWPDMFRGRDIFIRMDPGQGRGHHEHVRTAGLDSKFGIPLEAAGELERAVKEAGARVVGLHAHSGSGVLNPQAWLDTGEALATLLPRFPEVRFVDLGGGLGVPERLNEKPLDLASLNQAVARVRELTGEAELWLEPGRYLVAAAGVLLARVTQTKGKGERRYVGVSTGMNSLIRPALYGAYHEIVNLTRLDEAPTELVNIVGPNCETGDLLGSDRLLPPTQEGDVLLIANAGAYGHSMSSRYNLREPAGEILI